MIDRVLESLIRREEMEEFSSLSSEEKMVKSIAHLTDICDAHREALSMSLDLVERLKRRTESLEDRIKTLESAVAELGGIL